MPLAILIDFNTEDALARNFDHVTPIGVLLEDATEGFLVKYLETVTEDQDIGHDNWVRTMTAVERYVEDYRKRGESFDAVRFFTYLADNTYLGLRLHTVGLVENGMTIDEAFTKFVVNREPLPALEDEELPVDV